MSRENTQLGWLMYDRSERAEGVETVSMLVFGGISAMLRRREGVRIVRQNGGLVDKIIRSPEGPHQDWWLLMTDRVPDTGMPRLREDFAKVHRVLFDDAASLHLPADLMQERRDRGLFVVPGNVELGFTDLWVPPQYRPEADPQLTP